MSNTTNTSGLSPKKRTLLRVAETMILFYLEKKESLGHGRQDDKFGYSTDRRVRVSTADFTADFENAVRRVMEVATPLDRVFLKSSLSGEAETSSWLFRRTTLEEFRAVKYRSLIKLGDELILSGIYPIVEYRQAVDIR